MLSKSQKYKKYHKLKQCIISNPDGELCLVCYMRIRTRILDLNFEEEKKSAEELERGKYDYM